MARKKIVIRIEFSSRTLILGLVVALLTGLTLKLASETLTLSTTYPSPIGIYKTLITTDLTTFARYANNVILVPSTTNPSGKVGIGTSTPAKTLDVQGDTHASGNAFVDGKVTAGDVYINGSEAMTTLNCSGGVTCTYSGNNTWAISLSGTPPSPPSPPGPPPPPPSCMPDGSGPCGGSSQMGCCNNDCNTSGLGGFGICGSAAPPSPPPAPPQSCSTSADCAGAGGCCCAQSGQCQVASSCGESSYCM